MSEEVNELKKWLRIWVKASSLLKIGVDAGMNLELLDDFGGMMSDLCKNEVGFIYLCIY